MSEPVVVHWEEETADQLPSPRKYVLTDGVPVALILVMGIATVVHTTCVPSALAVQKSFAVSVPMLPLVAVPGAAAPIWGEKTWYTLFTLPVVSRLSVGEFVPIPNRFVVLFQKKLAASLASPVPSENCTEPATPDAVDPAVAHVLSPRRYVVAFAVPLPIRAVFTVPVARLLAFNAVTLEPSP
jgi:hypothetical protein